MSPSLSGSDVEDEDDAASDVSSEVSAAAPYRTICRDAPAHDPGGMSARPRSRPQDGFVVPAGYLSSDEMDEDDEGLYSGEEKAVLPREPQPRRVRGGSGRRAPNAQAINANGHAWFAARRDVPQLDQLVPVVVGPLYQPSWNTAAHPTLASFRVVPLPGTPALNIPVFPDPTATASTAPAAAPAAAQPAAEGAPASAAPAPGKHRPVPADALPVLAKMLDGTETTVPKIIQDFQALYGVTPQGSVHVGCVAASLTARRRPSTFALDAGTRTCPSARWSSRWPRWRLRSGAAGRPRYDSGSGCMLRA